MYYEPNEDFLMHYGIKGMKWGVRRKGNETTKAARAKKRKAKKAKKEALKNSKLDNAAIKSYKMNERASTVKALDSLSKKDIVGAAYYGRQARNYRKGRERYEDLMDPKAAAKKKLNEQKKTGAQKAANVMGKIGSLYLTDQLFNDGKATKLAKSTIKNTGRFVVTGYVKARGGYDIRWYD